MTKRESNDTVPLMPRTEFDNNILEFDFPSFQIGVAEYVEGPTGCTVFYFPQGARTAVDMRGGSVGTIGNYPHNNAICFAGGSLYGLEAATGVAAELFARHEYSVDFEKIMAVSGAIIFDFPSRQNSVYPDKALGRTAVRAAQTNRFPLGARGAGISATVGNGLNFDAGQPSGQGGAFRQAGETKVAVFTVVNAIGAIVNRQGEVVYGHYDRQHESHFHAITEVEGIVAEGERPSTQAGNTTLTLVVTNQKLNRFELTQMAWQVHSSMARAIQPFHTIFDGDVLYAVTTDEVQNPTLNAIGLGILASEVAWDAILSVADTLKLEAR